jgi:uncharacterized membrane protein
MMLWNAKKEGQKTITMKETKFNAKFMALGAIIAAMYVALTIIFAPISYGAVQVRISEAFTTLPLFTPAAIPGLTLGCLLFNITFAQALPLDFLVGSLATVLAAVCMWKTRGITIKGYPLLSLAMPAFWNALLVGWELTVYIGGGFLLNALLVAIGELVVLYTLGSALFCAIKLRHLDSRLFGA